MSVSECPPSSFSCEIRIIRAKINLETPLSGNFFIRYYLSAGNNKRIQLDTRKLQSIGVPNNDTHLLWNESFSLECNGTKKSINNLKQQTVVFELRWKSTDSILGRVNVDRSRVLGTAELGWQRVFDESQLDMELETWVPMSMSDGSAALQVSLKVTPIYDPNKKEKEKSTECGCSGGCGSASADAEAFALAAAFEGL